MERLNLLEEKIVNEQVQDAIKTTCHALSHFNNLLGKYAHNVKFMDTILKYLKTDNISNKGAVLTIGNEEGMIEVRLAEVLREFAIEEFYKRLDKVE